ncbi:MAG: nucleotidyl transferase AbiEii/AbiGii toxin family protein, partial [Thermoplasmata archaeon]
VLWGIGTEVGLSDEWIFKGGTCLKKCYLETYRFSEDLDFTVLPIGPVKPNEVEPLLVRALARVGDESGIDFTRQAPLFKGHSSGRYTEGRAYYVGPRATPGVASIRLDLTSSEVVVRPTVRRPIAHSYPDHLPGAGDVRCYAPEEVFAEKLRALGERARPRDLYDVVNLYRRQELPVTPPEVQTVLIEKCRTKGVAVPTVEGVLAGPRRAELEAEWENMLGHQLPALPPIADFIAELPHVFEWLTGSRIRPVLPSVPALPHAGENVAWRAPSSIAIWHRAVPLETVRFAAVNHLLVNLRYQGSSRLIEPYALRETRDGNLLLHAIRADDREHRSYRVDRSEGVTVTNQSFVPQFAIEFSQSGTIAAPPATPRSHAAPWNATRRASSTRSQTGSPTYWVQCPVCQKRFRRSSPSDTDLNEHKNEYGQRCSGSGRRGYLVG